MQTTVELAAEPPQATVRYPSGEPPLPPPSNRGLQGAEAASASNGSAATSNGSASANASVESEDSPAALLRQARRRAVRASIEASEDPGVYIVRLLKNGEYAGAGAHEAMVVLVDPRAELFVAP